jgi:hypothetical protein
MPDRSEEKLAYWRGVLERQQESGLSIRRFCREEQVSEASFHNWRRKIAGRRGPTVASSQGSGRDRAAKKRRRRRDEKAAVFIPLRVRPAVGSLLEVIHPRGCVVRVPAAFDEHSLRAVLKVLDHEGDR